MGRFHALLGVLILLAAGVRASPVDLVPRVVPQIGRPQVAVMTVGVDTPSREAAGALDYGAQVSAERSARFEMVHLQDALDPAGARSRQARLGEARAASEAGQKAYDELDAKRAMESFSEAVKTLKQADLSRNFADLSKAWVMKIASLVADGQVRVAEAEIERLVALDPRATFSPNYFAPDFLKRVESARRQAARGSVELDVRTVPAGAQVYVNGDFKGSSPVKVRGLAAAENTLTVVAPGYALAQQQVSPGLVEVNLRKVDSYARWSDLVERVASDPDGAGRDGAARDLAAWLGVDQVVVLVARKSVTGQRLEVTAVRLEPGGHNLGYSTGMVDLGDNLGPDVDRLLSTVLNRDEPRRDGPVTHFSGGGGGRGGHKPILGYSLVGAGVALIGGAVVCGILANGQAAQFRQTPQTDPASNDIRSRGKTYAVLTDVFAVAGLAAGGSGAWFTLRGGPGQPTVQKEVVVEQPSTVEPPLRETLPRESSPADRVEPKVEKPEKERKKPEDGRKRDSDRRRKSREEKKRDDDDELRNY